MFRVIRTLALAVAFSALPALVSHAAPDEVLRPGERVRVVLAEGESRTVAIAGLEGGRWTVSAVPTGKSKAAPTFSLVDPDGQVVELGRALKNVGRGKGVKSFPMSKSGVWRLKFGTPAGKPGEVEISVTAKLPKTPKIAGTTAGEPATATIPFHALPSSSCDAKVKLAAKPAQRVDLRILAPGGDEVAAAGGDANTAALDDVDLDRTGGFALEVAGGPSKFSGTLRVKAPKPRRDLTFLAVEALPEFRSISPAVTTNDVNRGFVLGGFGYTATNTLVLKLNGVSKRTAAVVVQPDGSGKATMSLDDVPAGTYTASVSLPGGRSVTLDTTVEVTNLVGTIGSITPPESPSLQPFDVYIVGQGFDPDATIEVRRPSDGATVAVSQAVRQDPRTWRARFTPQITKTGVYELRIVERGLAGPSLPGGFDVLGRKEPELSLRNGGPFMYILDSDADEETGRIGIAYLDGARAVFQLVDATTGATVSTYSAALSAGTSHEVPRIAFHPVDRIWAFNWTSKVNSTTKQAFHGTAQRSDFTNPQGTGAPWASGAAFDNTEAVPDIVNGGWRFVWSQFQATATTVGYISSVPVSSSGMVDMNRVLRVAMHPQGRIAYADALTRPDGDIVVVFVGDDFFQDLSVHRAVIAPDGTMRVASESVVSGAQWDTIYSPRCALNPDDGSVVVGFTYELSGILRPAFFRLDPLTHVASEVSAVVPDGIAPEGFFDDITWSTERGEFVATLQTFDGQVTIRRVNRDGTMRPSYKLEQYEGLSGRVTLVGGELRLLRTCDGVDDGVHSVSQSNLVARMFRMR